ncbi:MAG: TusE/DsrC/DsvC family sulfur relay protein [Gammaproteobacteria bacterium]|nr:TusE/DsrC/DsvC family sulfur relay protein [Gammaproteobacteria bacterium]
MTTQVNTEMIEDSNRDARINETRHWSEDDARSKAAEMDVDIDAEKIEVLHLLRDVYIDHGWEMPAHELTQLLDKKYADKGGIKKLHKMFPGGPVTQGAQLAGLPVPPYADDKGFGSAQ